MRDIYIFFSYTDKEVIMKILAFSDVTKWIGYEQIVKKYKPDVVCLCGDLVSDGSAWIYHEEFFEQIPKFRTEVEKLRKKYEYKEKLGEFEVIRYHKDYTELSYSLKKKFMDTPEYHQLKNLLHVDKFYSFLSYAGARSKVLLVKGDHDDDFKGDYDVERINSIPGCSEISDKLVEVKGFRFLGVSAKDAHNQRKLQRFSKNLRGQVDVVLMHGENVKLVSMISPMLIIKGGLFVTKCRVNGIPTVFTGPNSFSLIEFNNRGVQEVHQYLTWGNKPQLIKEKEIAKNCSLLSKRYPWIKPL